MSQQLLRYVRSLFVPVAAFVILAFLFSLSTLLYSSAAGPPALPQYTVGYSLRELILHAVFGFAAGLFTMNIRLASITAAYAVLLDVDHVPAVLSRNFFFANLVSRPDHNLAFIAFIMVMLPFFLRHRTEKPYQFTAMALAAGLSHLSLDTYEEGGVFWLFVPLSFSSYALPHWYWLPLEAAAAVVATIVGAGNIRRRLNRINRTAFPSWKTSASFSSYALPQWYWLPLEIFAIVAAATIGAKNVHERLKADRTNFFDLQ